MTRYWVTLGDEEYEVEVDEPGGPLLVTVAGRPHRVDLTETVPSAYTLVVDDGCHDLVKWDRAGPWVFYLDGCRFAAEVARSRRAVAGGRQSQGARSGEVRSPMPGLLIAVQVGEGAPVVAGQSLVIMEAMKMELEIRAPHAGLVRWVHVTPGQELTAGQLLVTIGVNDAAQEPGIPAEG